LRSFLSGRVTRHVDDLELDAVGIVEEDCVVAGDVAVLLGAALDLRAAGAQPLGALVDDEARASLERQVVEADAVAVVRLVGVCLRLAQPDRAAGAGEVPDRFAALALDLADPVPAERLEQLTVERQAAQDRRYDEVDVVNACGTQCRGAPNDLPRAG
jgi:hypothetical protein